MPDAVPTVDNKVTVLILQHPQEQDHVLGTAGLLRRTLANARLAVGLSWRNLGHALGEPAEARDWGVLYLGSAHAALGKGRSSRSIARAKRWPTRTRRCAGLKGLVVLDGNWAQAKALWWRNAWLTKLRRFVVVPDGPSLYGNLRRRRGPTPSRRSRRWPWRCRRWRRDPTVRERLLVPFRELIAKARAAGVQGGKRDRRRRR